MSDYHDVIVIGGGVAGALVAKLLSQSGKTVLVLEAGITGAMNPTTYRQYLQHYYKEGSMRGMPNGPYPWNPAAPSPGIPTAPTSYYQYDPSSPKTQFMSDYLRMLGGSTLHWQGTSLRLVPNDFRMQSAYGVAQDWPLNYDDLEPAYRRAEFELGVSADVEDQRIHGVWFPEDYVYPMHRMPQSCIDQYFDRSLENVSVTLHGGNYPVKVISIPMARNSNPNPLYAKSQGYDPVPAVGDRDKGQRCQGNSNCLPICPVQAKYSALKTLQSLGETESVEIRTQCVASRLVIDNATGRISGVEYKKYQSPDSPKYVTETAKGAFVVAAGNAIQNAILLLASKAANSSGQVGLNLMDHPYILCYGYAPERVYPFRGPDTTSGVESLRDGKFREVHAAFRASLGNWGWSGAPAVQVGQLLAANYYGKDFRLKLADRMTRMVRIGFMLEQLPAPSNKVSIDSKYTDALGNYRPVLSYDYDAYTLKGFEAVRQVVWPAIVKKAGIQDCTDSPGTVPGGTQPVSFNGQQYNVMGSGHIVGTHLMGNDRAKSVTDNRMKSWDHSNLFIVGAGSQVTVGTANPTLTVAALAVRTAESIIAELR